MATQYYAGVNVSNMQDVASAGTSTTATADIELRIGDGTYVPGRHEILRALKVFERWVMNAGLNGRGANLPPGV